MTVPLVQPSKSRLGKGIYSLTRKQLERIGYSRKALLNISFVYLYEALKAVSIYPKHQASEVKLSYLLKAYLGGSTMLPGHYNSWSILRPSFVEGETDNPVAVRRFLQKLLHFWGSALRSRHTDPNFDQPTSLPLCKVQEVTK